MADDDSLSELSSLSSLSPAPSGDDELELKADGGILKFFKRVANDETADAAKPTPPRKRAPSPPHEYVFADNPDIPFIVIFRKQFDSVMPKSLPHFGPLELEQDLQQDPPGERVEQFLCAVLGLMLNRKQDIKLGHYQKALNEDAINGKDFKNQWPRHWTENPLARGGTFHSLTPEQRLDLLKTLVLWALGHSDAVKTLINKEYNTGKRQNEDRNQPLSVQPWGCDSDKRRYFLLEGADNCSFRVYRESNPAALYNRKWISIVGSIDELKALADKLVKDDGGPSARYLANLFLAHIPGFELNEEKRKRREYRRQQKERFRRPEPGFSIYEGRTRGKRVKYTYEEDEDFYTDSTNRRSTRNTRNPTPVETGPVVTASGRLSRAPARLNADETGADASAPSSIQGDAADTEMFGGLEELGPTGRPRRAAAVHHGTNGWAQARKRRRNVVTDDEDEEESEPDLGDDEEEEHVPLDETDDAEEFENDDVLEEDDQEFAADSPGSNGSRVVKLPIKVKFDKNGKAKRLLNDGETPSASTPSNIASSPEAADQSSGGSPSDIPNLKSEKIQDVVNVVPLKRSQPETISATTTTATATATVDAFGTNGHTQKTASSSANGTVGIPASTAPNVSSTLPPAESITATSVKVPATTGSVHTNGAHDSVSSDLSLPKPQPVLDRPVEKTAIDGLAPSPPSDGASPSLAFRASPEKIHTVPLPATGSAKGGD